MDTTGHGSLGVRTTIALLAAFAALVAARIPGAFTLGRFWAEEGAVYFANAWNRPWQDALFAVHTGYINIAASLATLLAVHLVPVVDAPLFTAAFALLIQVCPAILLATSGIAWLRRPIVLIAAMLIVATPLNSAEVWLNTITSQFHLALCAALILASPTRGGAIGIFRAVLLVLGGLSGPASAFLAPLFVLRAAIDRSPARALQAAVLGVAVTVEALMVLLHPEPSRGIGIDPRTLLLVMYEKHIVLPTLGTRAARAIAIGIYNLVRSGGVPWLAYVTAPSVFVALIAGVVHARNKEAAWLFAAGMMVAFLSYFGALGDHGSLLAIDFGLRYAYVPSVLFGLALLGIAATARGLVRGVASALTAWLIFVGLVGYFGVGSGFTTGPAWRDEVASWRADPSYRVQLWPGSDPAWRFWLGPPPGSEGRPR
jgi:hypothetical protein